VGLLALLIVSQVDFIIGTFLPPTDELKAKGFIGYNATVMETNLWSAYTHNEESGSQHNFFSVFAVFFPGVNVLKSFHHWIAIYICLLGLGKYFQHILMQGSVQAHEL
jgi:hypothetical protein